VFQKFDESYLPLNYPMLYNFLTETSSRFATSFRGINRLGPASWLCDDSELHISAIKKLISTKVTQSNVSAIF